ncbi:hypothetical protein X975_03398, partial [Stegodyphus mimosarum]
MGPREQYKQAAMDVLPVWACSLIFLSSESLKLAEFQYTVSVFQTESHRPADVPVCLQHRPCLLYHQDFQQENELR